MKRLMLIQPWNYHDEGIADHDFSQEWRNGPYSLLLLGTQLQRANVPFCIVDLQPILVKGKGDVQECLKYLKNALLEFRPQIVGVSFFSYQYLEAKKIVRFVKRVSKSIKINPAFIAGGIHPSIEPEISIEQLGFDYAFVGEGELGIVEVASGKIPDNIPGIVTIKNATFKNADIVKDLDTLPFPDWGLCDYKFYSTPSSGKIPWRKASTLDVMMGRGCPFECSFCAYPTLSAVRFYPAEYLVEQIKLMKKSYAIDSVYFTDSSIGNNRKLLRRFCELMIESNIAEGIEWYANMRTDQVDEDLLRLMWEAGCRSLLYGFESGSQRVLDAMNKKCSIENNIRAAELHDHLQFPYHASMIFGFPGETEEDIHLTMEFIRKFRPPTVGINWYVPLPGSPDYDQLRSKGMISVENPHEWRRIGETITTGRVYAEVKEDRFRQLFSEACQLAQELKESSTGKWRRAKTSGGIKRQFKLVIIPTIKNSLQRSWHFQGLRHYIRSFPILGFLIWRVYRIIKTLFKDV